MAELIKGYLAYYKDFKGDPVDWMVVIVKQDRSGEPGVGEVVTWKTGTKDECEEFAAPYLGSDSKLVYEQPTIQ